MRAKKTLRWLGWALIITALLLVGYYFLTDFWTGQAQRSLKREWSKTIEAAKSSPGKDSKTPSLGSGIARLVIPKIKLDVIVVEGTVATALRKGPGHLKGTALPGEVGNCVISGHRVTYAHPFRRLDEIGKGDSIILYTKKGRFDFSVADKKIVKPKDTSVVGPTPDMTLTLTACHPFYSARYRIVIIAKLTSDISS